MLEGQIDSATAMSSPPTVGPYEILGEIDGGGQGRIFRARDPRLGREVALKILHRDVDHDPERRRRFLDEARAACRLNHPNILVVHDVGTDGDQPYLVTELIDGRSLKDELDAGPMPMSRVLDLATQIADGLAAAHRVPLVHRDLKPGNVMIANGRAKIIDFGLAKLTEGVPDGAATHTQTAAHAILGTPPYMSPEQARGSAVDYRSDIFSFGSMVYEMVTRRRAFERSTPIETLTAIQHDEPPPMRESNPRVPGRLQDIVQRCLAKLPEERYGSTADLVHDLKALRDGRVSTDSAVTPVPPTARPWWTTGVARATAAIIAAATVALAAALALNGTPAGRDLSQYRIVPVATDAGYEGSPAWSPDGQTLAYIAERDGVMQMMARNLESSRSVQLTRAVADCRNPLWSADGSRVYYISLAGSQDSLWSVSSAGGNPQLELRNVAVATLSPDGSALVFLRDEGAYEMRAWVSTPVGHEPTPFGASLLLTSGGISTMRFSPDGTRIAFWLNSVRNDASPDDRPTFVVADYPSGAWRETPALARVSRPHPFAWMPDNRHIVFGADLFGRSLGTHLWLADTESGAFEALTASSTSEYEPAVSPDGHKVAFVADASHYDVVEVPVDGGPVVDRRANASDDSDPVWSPTGRQYAYVTNRAGDRGIWLSDTDGAVDVPLVVARAFRTETSLLSRPAFSPDGQRLVYQRRDPAGYALWVTPAAGGSPVQVMPRTVASYQDAPAWSPSGDWLAFTYILNAEARTWRLGKTRPGANGDIIELRKDINFLSSPQWSPDGLWITVELQDGLYAVSPEGPEQRLISRDPWIVHTWSRDSKSILAVRQSDDNRLQLASIDVASQAVRILNPDLGPVPATTPPLRGFSLSPDGTRLLTSIARLRGDVHVLDGFERDDGWQARLRRMLPSRPAVDSTAST